MGIAFSQRKVIRTLIPGANQESFIEAIDLALPFAGWTRIEAVDDGFKYRLTSDQGLIARCIIKPHSTAQIIVQFLSEDETQLGREHFLLMQAGREFVLIAGHCQMFLYLPEYSDDEHDGAHQHSVAGGIPYVDPAEIGSEVEGQCALTSDDDDITTELWWSSSDCTGAVDGRANFRYSLICHQAVWSACRNGVEAHTGSTGGDALVIYPLRHPNSPAYPSGQITAFVDGTNLWIDPLIGWGDRNGITKVRGQLWDAQLATVDKPLDDEFLSEEQDVNSETGQASWINYTHYKGSMTEGEPHSYNGSLYLLSRVYQNGDDSNYAY